MEREQILLWQEGQIPFYDEQCQTPENEGTCTITPYLLEDGKEHAAVLVFPGGGYTHRCADKEGSAVAEYLNTLGLHAFIVNYRVIPYVPYLGVVDGKRAMRYVRKHAKEYGIRPDAIGVMGFSAGAGNACMVAELYDAEDYPVTDEIDAECARPDFCIFGYGALGLKPESMHESDREVFEQMVAEEGREEFIKKYSCDALVRENMPPTFMWHTMEDTRVRVDVALDFVQSMSKAGNDVECHLFPEGAHGMSVRESRGVPGLEQWLTLLENWLARKNFR